MEVTKNYDPRLKDCTDKINSGKATDKTYVQLIEAILAPDPPRIRPCVGIFWAYRRLGRSQQDSFDLAMNKAFYPQERRAQSL